jgi:hypothetical protein
MGRSVQLKKVNLNIHHPKEINQGRAKKQKTMTDQVMNACALQAFIVNTFHTEQVKVRKKGI